MDKLGQFFDAGMTFWMANQVNVVLFVILVAIVVMLISAAKAAWTIWTRRRKKKVFTLYDWLDLVSSKFNNSITEMGTSAMSLDDPNVRVFTVKQVRAMFGDTIHDLLKEAVNRHFMTGVEADKFRDYCARKLGDIDLFPAKTQSPPPASGIVKAGIRNRLKILRRTPKPVIPDENSIHVDAGTDVLSILKRNKAKA